MGPEVGLAQRLAFCRPCSNLSSHAKKEGRVPHCSINHSANNTPSFSGLGQPQEKSDSTLVRKFGRQIWVAPTQGEYYIN